MKKPQKQILSVLFHLAVLCGMVILFDLVKPLIVGLNLGALVPSGDKKEESVEKASSGNAQKPVEKASSGNALKPVEKASSDKKVFTANSAEPAQSGGGKKTTGGTTMADLMAQKAEQQNRKAEELKKKKTE